MSRLERAIEILEAINNFYQEGGDWNAPLYGCAQILDGDVTIKDAISDCLGVKTGTDEPIIPRSMHRRWNYTHHGGYSGWIGKRKIKNFYTREEAQAWEKETS